MYQVGMDLQIIRALFNEVCLPQDSICILRMATDLEKQKSFSMRMKHIKDLLG